MTQRKRKAPKKAPAKAVKIAPMKKKAGMPPHVPTSDTRAIVCMAMGGGFTQAAVAGVLKINETTLRKYYAHELETGAEQASLIVAGNLFRLATQTLDNKAAVTAGIFWLKTRQRWRTGEGVSAEVESPPGEGVPGADGKPWRIKLVIGQRDAEEGA